MTADLSPCRQILARDPMLYLDMTEPVRRGTGVVHFASPEGALVEVDTRGQGDVIYTLCAANLETAEKLCRMIPNSAVFVTVHEKLCFPLLRQRVGYETINGCWQVGYLGHTPLPLPELGLEVRRLEPCHIPLVEARYTLVEEGYAASVLRRGDLYGAFRGEKLWGFAGFHPEGTIGLLEVFPEHRRQGVGALLQAYLTNLELARGNIPYGQVFEGNEPSLALQRSLGFQQARSRMYWPEFS